MDALLLAQDFYEAYRRCLYPKGKDKLIVSIPAFTNGFFACEIYLKYLLTKHGIDARGHDLLELFDKLPHKLKDSISDKFNFSAKNFLRINKISFVELIKKVSFGFGFWRYVFEEKNKEFEENYPFLYSENFLLYFLPIINEYAKEFTDV